MLPSDDDRIAETLARCLEARERGEPVDLHVLCGGDSVLERRVEALLGFDAHAMRELRARSSARNGAAAGEGVDLPPRLGEFAIIARLGSGGMGKVYLAEQSSLRRLVALKVFDASLFPDAASIARFRREAEITAALEHPSIVPIHAIGVDGDRHYIAMKWLTGPGLDRLEQPVPPDEVARIGIAVARALDQAHRGGVVHRDVKPGNVILDDGHPVVVDFGLCRPVAEPTMTGRGVVPGTLPYMPPDAFRNGAAETHPRVDVYGLGATLYELAAGRPPFEADSPERLIHDILHREPAPLHLARRDRDLETILLRALAKEPSQRFATCQELADELERFRSGEEILSQRAGPVSRSIRFVRRRRVASVAVMAATVLFALFTRGILQDRERLAQGASSLDAALASRDRLRARTVLDTLVEQYGPTGRGIPELVRHVQRLEAEEALIDLVMDRREDVAPKTLDDALARLRSTGDIDDAPRYVQLAIALVHLYRNETERAVERLATLERSTRADGGSGRATAAIRACISPTTARDADLDLQDEPRVALEHVFTALALRILSRSNDEWKAELERALSLDPRDARAMYVRARLLFAEGEYESARIAFEYLAPAGHAEATRQTFIAWLDVVDGDPDAALARTDAIPSGERTPRTYLVRADAWRRKDAPDAVTRELEAALARWPNAPQVNIGLGAWRWEQARELAQATGDATIAASEIARAKQEARERFAAALQNASFGHQHEAARLHVLIAAADDEIAAPGVGPNRLLDVALRLREFADSCQDVNVKARALDYVGTLSHQAGDFGAALRAHRDALEAEPDSIRARLGIARLLCESKRGFDEVERRADEVRAREGRGRVAPTFDEITEAMFYSAIVAFFGRRNDECHALATRALEREPADPKLRALCAKLVASSTP